MIVRHSCGQFNPHLAYQLLKIITLKKLLQCTNIASDQNLLDSEKLPRQ